MSGQNQDYSRKKAEFDEALLEHYDDLGSMADYQATLERMRRNGYEPRGPGAPQPGSPFYKRG